VGDHNQWWHQQYRDGDDPPKQHGSVWRLKDFTSYVEDWIEDR
jgi:hypothetical protein